MSYGRKARNVVKHEPAGRPAYSVDRVRIERKAGHQVATALAAIKRPSSAKLVKAIKVLFKREPKREWRDHVKAVAASLKPKERRRRGIKRRAPNPRGDAPL